ncbi:response regulator [Streptosporangium lutulentum]
MAIAREAIREGLRGTRQLSADLWERVGDDSLEVALGKYLRTTVPRSTRTTLTTFGDETDLPWEVREELYILLREAVRNALLHSGTTEIHVELEGADGVLRAAVSDRGCGFDVVATRQARRGGGLTSMRERAALLGGTVNLSSRVGEGTTVEVLVPLAEDPGLGPWNGWGREVTPQTGEERVTLTDPDERRIRVMLADDHTLFRDGLAELIQTDPAFEVVGQAADGDKIIELVPIMRPDIVIVDVEMPGPGARAVVSTLRRVCPEATVIVLTMHQNARIVQELLDCGAAAYLVKNIARDQLIAALHAVHQSPRNILLSVSRETLGHGEPPRGTGRCRRGRWRCCGSPPTPTPTPRSRPGSASPRPR